MVKYNPEKLLEFFRDGLVEQEHYGFIVKYTIEDKINKIGDDNDYPYFLRSCAKPLQAALLIDYGLDEFYNMTSEEIAICCASHSGEPCHVKVVKGFLDKVGLDESYLKCGLHKPLSKTEQNKLLISGEKETILQNNCSGKHAMMLAICKKNGWRINDYDKPEHPLQISIKQKIYELCCCEADYPMTKDGCGVPIYSMPLKNMVRGYLNLFLDEKYIKIKTAFVNHPYLIGGEERLDTAIMEANDKLISKVGAGGLCIVINIEKKEGLIVKIMDCDMKARAICLIEALHQLGWFDDKMLGHELIKIQNKIDILTLHGEKLGSAKFCFKF